MTRVPLLVVNEWHSPRQAMALQLQRLSLWGELPVWDEVQVCAVALALDRATKRAIEKLCHWMAFDSCFRGEVAKCGLRLSTCFCKYSMTGTKPQSSVDVLFMAAVVLLGKVEQ